MKINAQLEHLKQFGTATLHEAQGRKGALNSAIKPIDPRMRLVGPAFTVDCHPADNLMIHYALSLIGRGDILVVDAKGSLEGGSWGDVLTLAAQKRGVGGLVIDGAVRDSDSIIKMGFPVFSCGLSIKGTSKVLGGKINVPICCGGVIVSPGDLLVGDRDGVVVIERKAVDDVIRAAENREEHEAEMREALEKGKTTIELLNLLPVLQRLGFGAPERMVSGSDPKTP
jgi:4-hydroxy-4-methyl-2-oxoglutarate aldolase